MSKWSRWCVPGVMLLLLLGQPSSGQTFAFQDPPELDPNASLNFLLTSPSYMGCGTFDESRYLDCDQLVSPPHPDTAFLWVILSREGGFPPGTGGLQFGIEHVGVDIIAWASCGGGGDIPLPDWPASGSGIGVLWSQDNCEHPGENAKVGYLTLSDGSSGAIAFIPPPPPAQFGVVWNVCAGPPGFMICSANLSGANLAQGTTPLCGDNCSGTPIEETTWSSVKALFR